MSYCGECLMRDVKVVALVGGKCPECAKLKRKKSRKLEPGEMVQWWHPVKGGWRAAVLVKMGRKWARVRYTPMYSGPITKRVPALNVRRLEA